MSDPKRATLITVGAPKSAKNKVTKTVRLTINLDESNESKYPELNYKELVITEERKKRVENGKTGGLDPFSDNDDDVERVARKFEQKYGGKSTYGRRGRKRDDFADIGAGYDENDSFIDNTHGYDEMIPPECDTLYGGFYINSGSLEFKTVPDGQNGNSDEPAANRKKRCISSSSSEDESSESSSESESAEEKEPKAIANGTLDSHETEHRKKKNKKIDKKKADKIRRTDSSAATSGKQTSDDNGPGDAESADSRTSQSDSLTSKPAPSSENAITSDSSRDVESKVEVKLPQAVSQVLEELEALVRLLHSVNTSSEDVELKADPYIIRLERSLAECSAGSRVQRAAWGRAARLLRLGRHRLQRRAADLTRDNATPTTTIAQTTVNSVTTATITTVNTTTTNTTTTNTTTTNTTTSNTTTTNTTSNTTTTTTSNKRKYEEDTDIMDISRLTADEKEAKIVETLQRLKTLIEERRPGMIANYNAECERVQEERKKIQIASRSEGAPMIEKRLPKRRFPWCGRSRALLARLARLAGAAPADLLARRALPLFPKGFVRMPTLLRQADLSKEMKAAETKRQRTNEPVSQTVPYTEQIQFPSSLTVTTSVKTSDKQETEDKDSKYKINPAVFGKIINYSISNDLIVEKSDDKKKENDKIKEDYIPTNNIGCITITPVPNQKPLKKNNIITDKKEPLIKVISPAALNEMVKKDKHKKPEKKKNRVESPLHIDTGYQNKETTASPKKEEVTQKQLESMRTAENNLPRPALVPVHHSPTFAKPDKRPPEVKKKKDVMIMSDVDPLGDIIQEPVAIDDSSSDIEVVEDKNIDKSDKTVPLSDKVCSEVNSVKKDSKECQQNYLEESTNEDMDNLMRNIIAMEHSQEPAKLNCNSYGGVITSAKHESNKQYNARNTIFGGQHSDKNKLFISWP
ncbi:PREDICTED: yemanuclein-alpha isoform X3 [Papilio polytes]|uniref:yemanuclein-alpha isoform X3 n=1 Tax=Papilio polytes TaxID=76194 RepID=UPI000676147A|nr:PREDICTED: yemanuclein-alpha isoform X3 [Papilio polytes]